ncbi:UNVERIFIED_CONTAM: hypothetical protein PYX00_007448 [Menopon gallinae]|uniref:G-protein coupled receptors family 1 profile domain-containing protein n=1 Tax=Menopon gallinae TaxID=328185 RepID=A0AAW2HJ75_9NEOP
MSAGYAVNQTSDRPASLQELSAAPVAVVASVLFVFALSPIILCGNFLILSAVYRFKRLRTPSNYLVCSLATSDFGVGLFLPAGMYVELTESGSCLVAYCAAITLCSASVIVMAAIAVDRFTSLSQPLRYNDLITHTSMQRYLIGFWVYSIAVGFCPMVYIHSLSRSINRECFFPSLVDKSVQLFLFCTIYGPCCAILVLCYAYIYILARYHARAIYTVEISIRQGGSEHITVSRYGQTLAITVGCFVCLWTPFQSCMLVDIFNGTKLLGNWMSIYLSLPIFASSAINPWIYGYRNSEIRASVQRVIDDIFGKLGIPMQGCPDGCRHHGEQAELNSLVSNVRLCASSPNRVTTLLLTPHGNGHLEKNSSLLTVPEGDFEFVVNTQQLLETTTCNDD